MFRSALDPGRPPTLTVLVNGVETPAWEGETVASVMLRVPSSWRVTPVTGTPRAPYCQMGVCFDCLTVVDGVGSTQGCLVPVRQGMRIERQADLREVTR
jgi:D-hydroxyproline dehydrogenase subunit gamma